MSTTKPIRLTAETLETRDTPSGSPIFSVSSGTGGPPRVQVFNVNNGQKIGDFLAFESTFTGGLNTAVGDVTGDGFVDLIIGAGIGGGPRVKVIDGRIFNTTSTIGRPPVDGVSVIPDGFVIADFFAFESTQRGGVYTTVGTFSGATFADLVIGAGPGGGPRVRVLEGQQISLQGRNYTSDRTGDTIANFFAYEPTFRNGVLVSASPANFGFSDIVTSPGLGGSPRVRVLSGNQISARQLQFTSTGPNETIADFFAGDPNSRAGVFVSTADYNRDGINDVAVGNGPGLLGTVTLYSGAAIRQGNFTGGAAGDILTAFTIEDGYTNGVTVGSALTPTSLTSGLLLVGTGGQGRSGRARVLEFTPGSGFLDRRVVYDIQFDQNFVGGVFVSQ